MAAISGEQNGQRRWRPFFFGNKRGVAGDWVAIMRPCAAAPVRARMRYATDVARRQIQTRVSSPEQLQDGYRVTSSPSPSSLCAANKLARWRDHLVIDQKSIRLECIHMKGKSITRMFRILYVTAICINISLWCTMPWNDCIMVMLWLRYISGTHWWYWHCTRNILAY